MTSTAADLVKNWRFQGPTVLTIRTFSPQKRGRLTMFIVRRPREMYSDIKASCLKYRFFEYWGQFARL